MKNVLFYLGHPAQYHFVKNTVVQLKHDGNDVIVLIKTKDILEDLLKEDGVEYVNIQSQPRGNGKLDILIASFRRTKAVLSIAKKFKADVLIGTDSSVAQVAWMLRKPAITVLEDDYEVIKNLAKLTYPFTSCILVPSVCQVGPYEKKKVGYSGYMKLAYLHPNCFTPDKAILSKYGLPDQFILIRLAKLSAHHDVGIKGLNLDLVHEMISKAEKYGYRVYITSETDLDVSLQPYQLRIAYRDIHHILAFAGLLVSDSQSMSVEAAVLGVPSVRFSDFAGRISVLEELEQTYHLTFGVPTDKPEQLVEKVDKLLSDTELRETFQRNRALMLDDNIDVTSFFTWFIENYPESQKIMKENPGYQYEFK
ncbi:MAG: DUF354 domain-containing protein [Bacteroidales bacterium]|nr:DUF354 domain-containing protein [Bacteroidales bacterium]